ncbi:lasso RiPP family leader peptide-containing protein [Streptomyces sp. NPDC053079]
MDERTEVLYVPPMLEEIGDFAEDTRGGTGTLQEPLVGLFNFPSG